jgi:hypothetical protein
MPMTRKLSNDRYGSKADKPQKRTWGTDTRTNCQCVGAQHRKIGDPDQYPETIAALTMIARVFSGCCESAQRVKFRSSAHAGRSLRQCVLALLRIVSTRLSVTPTHEIEASKHAAIALGFCS